MRELRCLWRSSAVQQEGQFHPSKFVCVSLRTRFLFVSVPNSVNTSRDSQRACVLVCVCNKYRVCVCVCVHENEGVHANVCALVCCFDFSGLSGLYLFLRSNNIFSSPFPAVSLLSIPLSLSLSLFILLVCLSLSLSPPS